MRGTGGGGAEMSPAQASAPAATAARARLRVTVLASHETHREGQLVGELRQLGGALREFLNRFQLLRRRGGDRLGFLSGGLGDGLGLMERLGDRKSTRLNSSHPSISYAVFCLKK